MSNWSCDQTLIDFHLVLTAKGHEGWEIEKLGVCKYNVIHCIIIYIKNVPILIYISSMSSYTDPPSIFLLHVRRTCSSWKSEPWHPFFFGILALFTILCWPSQYKMILVPFFPIREGVLLFIPVFSAAPQPLLAASLNSSFQHIKELQLGRRQGREERHFLVRKHTYVTSAQSRDWCVRTIGEIHH